MRACLCCWFVLLGAVATASPQTPAASRDVAIRHALNFLSSAAADDGLFSTYGHDLVLSFYDTSHNSRDPKLRKLAAALGKQLAERWHRIHQHVPADADATTIIHLVQGGYAAERFGIKDPQFKAELREAAQKFTAKDYLGFDAVHQPPPPTAENRYDLWCDALIFTHFGDAYGVRLGAGYRDVLRWLPQMRPYEPPDDSVEFDMFYSVTHLIYTLNAYGTRKVDPALLPQEVAFLKRELPAAIESDDPEMVGEALDCLKAFGMEDDPLVRKGTDYLLSTQRTDGTWADQDDERYTAYHSAWTGLDGLRDYRFRGTVRKLPR